MQLIRPFSLDLETFRSNLSQKVNLLFAFLMVFLNLVSRVMTANGFTAGFLKVKSSDSECSNVRTYSLNFLALTSDFDVSAGYRNVSNCLSVGSKIDRMSDDLKEKAAELGFWDRSSDFNFKQVLGTGDCSRLAAGEKLLSTLTGEGLSLRPEMRFSIGGNL